jgi:hypothetical protein
MNNELIEKLKAIREYLMALQAQAQAGDAKKLADLINQNAPGLDEQSRDEQLGPMWRDYQKLVPYMTEHQRVTAKSRIGYFRSRASIYQFYPETGAQNFCGFDSRETVKVRLIDFVNGYVPQMLADLDDIEREIKKNPKLGFLRN